MRVLVLGGYGLIGASVCRRLMTSADFVPVGLGRSIETGQAKLPAMEWRAADISKLDTPEAWAPFLEGIDAVVNCAGVLQDGLGDNVTAVQQTAMCAFYTACEIAGISRFIQISAPGARPDSDTAFYASKGVADAALMASPLDWTLLRPALVLSAEAYGGTALVRALAAFPLLQPLTLAGAYIDIVADSDVATAVEDALGGKYSRADIDLTSGEAVTLEALVLRMRRWLGFAPPRLVLRLPAWLGRVTAWAADVSGWLGWRSGLRTTAQKVLASGVRGDPAPWHAAGGHTLKTLDDIFMALPATAQERRFARLELLFPVLLLMLSGFWIASGLIGFVRQDAAMAYLTPVIPDGLARLAVLGGSGADMLIGAALLVRPLCRASALASVLLALAYMAGAAIWAPALWHDPLGPMVKVVPVIGLGLLFSLLPLRR